MVQLDCIRSDLQIAIAVHDSDICWLYVETVYPWIALQLEIV